MKRIVLLPAMAFMLHTAHAQFVHKIKADSVLITNDSCTAELNLENSTKNIKGFLYNKGNGRTEFRKVVKLNDSTLIIGADTVTIQGASGNYIKNQNIAAQPANFHIQGNAVIGAFENYRSLLGGFPSQAYVAHGNGNWGLTIQRASNNTGTASLTFFKNRNDDFSTLKPSPFYDRIGSINFVGVSGDSTTVTTAANISTFVEKVANNYLSSGVEVWTRDTNGVFKSSAYVSANGNFRIGGIAAVTRRMEVQSGDVMFNSLSASGNVLAGADNNGVFKKIKLGSAFTLNNDTLNTVTGNGWSLTGNAGTNQPNNFIGTTDNQDLALRTNNTERVRVAATGKVGMGTRNPLYKLDMRGSSDSTYTMIHLSRDTTDTGGYIGISQHPVMLLSADATPNSYNGNWIAKGTTAVMMSIAGGNNLNPNFGFFVNSGLTPGQSFGPWSLMQLNGGTAYGNMRGVGIGTPGTWHRLHVQHSDSNVAGIQNTANLSSTSGAMLRMYNSGTPSAADQRLGALAWGTGASISGMRTGARIQGFSEAAWTDNVSQPTYLTFETTPVNANASLERMRITAAGNIGIGTGTPAYKLDVNGKLGVRTIDSSASAVNMLYQDPATGEIKKTAVQPYKKYIALLSQSGDDDPTAIVLENTLGGTITWGRSITGLYVGTLTGAFTQNKTWFNSEASDTAGNVVATRLLWGNVNSVTLVVKDGTLTNMDGWTNLSIEIRIYQ